MKNLYLILCCLTTLFGTTLNAQVDIIGSSGADGTYASLTDAGGAFDVLNGAGAQTGSNITILITANLSGETGAYSLIGAGWNSLRINPSGPRVLIAGAQNGFINLMSASKVTIDGLNTGGNSLLISNANTSALTAGRGTSTIRFAGGSSNCRIANCTITGADTTTFSGTIFFDTASIAGNLNDTIMNCIIGNYSATAFPVNGIYSLGTSLTSPNTAFIFNNKIFNYYNAVRVTAGIWLGAGNKTWSILNNKLYQTANRLYTVGLGQFGMNILSGDGYTINNNTIGYADSSGTGRTCMIGNSALLAGFPTSYLSAGTYNVTRYIAISGAFTAAGATNNIQGNTIDGIALATSSGAATTNGILCGINVTSGSVNIGTSQGNIIGNISTSRGSMYSVCSTTGGAIVGIYVSSANTVDIRNNRMGGFDASGTTATLNGGYTGIDVTGAGNFTISNNSIGGTLAGNMRNGFIQSGAALGAGGATMSSTTGTVAAVVGIRSTMTGNILNINNDTLRNWLTSGTTTAVTGIICSGTLTGVNPIKNFNNNFLGMATTGAGSWMTYNFANSGAMFGISNTTGPNTCNMSISNNDFRGIIHAVAGTHAQTYISNTSATLSQTINSNTFTNLNVNTTGSVVFMRNDVALPAAGFCIANNNSIVTAFNKGSAGGNVGIYQTSGGPSSAIGSTKTATGNNFSNITVTGATTVNGWLDIEGATSGGPVKTITGNTFNSWTCGTSAVVVMNTGYCYTGTSISNNTLTNITGQGAITGILINTTNGGVTSTYNNNTITSLTSTGVGGAVIGISGGGTVASSITNITNNPITTLSSTSGAVTGILFSAINGTVSGNTIGTLSSGGAVAVSGITSSGTTSTISGNKIYDLSGSNATSTINGLLFSAGTTINAYNNIIGDLRAPIANAANPINGINITGGTNVNLSFNTVYLAATGGGALFGSSALNAATGTNLSLRNNILINNSASVGGGGFVCAYRRSSNAFTTHLLTSNSNILYAGTPATTKFYIFYDGTNRDSTLVQFKSRAIAVNGSEINSATENVSFVSTTGSNVNFLHVNTTASFVESGGVTVPGITTDFDNAVRNVSTPDIGADEIAGTALNIAPPITFGSNTITKTTANITFVDNSTNESGFIVYRATSSQGPYQLAGFALSTDVPGTGTSFTSAQSGMIGSTKYYFQIYSVGGTNSATFLFDSITTSACVGGLSGTYAIPGAYPNIRAALNDAKVNGLTGSTIFELGTAYTSSTDTFPLIVNDTIGCMSASGNTLTLQPSAAVTVPDTIVSANTNTTIDIHRANGFFINGRAGGIGTPKMLVIANTSTTGSAIRFINDANLNTIKNVDIEGNNTSASSGVVFFSTTTGINGNDNNIIDSCDIHGYAIGNPVNGIYSVGTTTLVGQNNDSNVVSNCNIYDYYHTSTGTAGINIAAGNSRWLINNNHFFQTASRSFTSTQTNRDIYIINATGNTSGSGFNITNNYFGGNNSAGTGLYTFTGTTAYLYSSLQVSAGIGNPTNIQGNIFRNISMTNGASIAIAMSCIQVNAGAVNVGTITGNTVGIANTDASISPAITFTNANATQGSFIPIFVSSGIMDVRNNIVAGIQLVGNATTGAVDFNGIGFNNGTLNLQNNTIGSTITPKSIFYASTSATSTTGSRFQGILLSINGTVNGLTITGNTIANMYSNFASTLAPATTGARGIGFVGTFTNTIPLNITNNTIRDITTYAQTTTTGLNQPLVGISLGAAGAFGTWNVSNNTIYNLNLSSTSSSATISSAGIFVSSVPPVGSFITKNKIYALNTSTANPNATVSGIEIAGGSMVYANNIIRLGLDGTGADNTLSNAFNGIRLSATVGNKIYFNSIGIYGTNVVSGSNTFAFNKTTTSTVNDSIRNNIFVNNRSNTSGLGKHYQFGLTSTTFLVLNNNVYFGDSLNGRFFGYNNGLDVNPFAAGWVATDLNSYTNNPNFVAPLAATPDLHIDGTLPAIVEQTGGVIPSILDDIDGQVRASFTPNDIGADAGIFINMICTGPPVSVTAALTNASPVCSTGSKSISISGFSPLPGYSFQWVESPTGAPMSFVPVTLGSGGLSTIYTTPTITSTMYYACQVLCSGSMTFTTSNTVAVVVNPLPTVSILPAAGNVCDGALVDYTASGASTYVWTATDYTAAGNPSYQLIQSSRFLPTMTAKPTLTNLTFATTAGQTLNTNYWVPSNPTYSVIGTSAAGCASVAATVTPTVISPYTTNISNVALTSNIATITTAVPHSIVVGDQVMISGIHISFPLNQVFNGTWTVSAVGSTTTFDFVRTYPNVASTAVTAGKVTGRYLPQSLATSNSPSPVCATGTPVTVTATNNGILGGGNTWTYTWFDSTGTNLLMTNAGSTSSTDAFTPATPAINKPYSYVAKVSNSICPNSYATASPTFNVGFTATTSSTDATCGNDGTITIKATGQDELLSWYTNNFNTGLLGFPFDSAFVEGTNWTSVASMFQEGSCVMHQNMTGQNGALIVKNPTGINTNNLKVDLDVSTGPQSIAFSINGGAGFAWSYGADVYDAGVTKTANCGMNAENGNGSGLKIAFDATPNGAPNVNGAYLMYNCITPDQSPTDVGVLAYSPGGYYQGLTNAHMSVSITDAGKISVWYNNVLIFDNVQLPPAYLAANKSTWKHTFTSRSGGACANESFDNLSIQYTPGYEYSITSTNGTNGAWMSSNIFANMAAGTYPVWVRLPSTPTCFTNTGNVTVGASGSPTTSKVVGFNGASTILCQGSSTILTNSANVPGASFAWEQSPTGGTGTWVAATGINNLANYTTSALLKDTFYRCTFTCPSALPVVADSLGVDVNIGSIVSTNSPQVINCLGSTDTLIATPGPNTTCVWYNDSIGGASLFTGTDFIVTPITLPKTYYVEPITSLYSNKFRGTGITSITNGFGGGFLTAATAYPVRFTTNQSIKIDTIRVYPGTAGVVTISLGNALSGTPFQTTTALITAGQINTMVKIPVNFTISGAGSYQIYATGVTLTSYSPTITINYATAPFMDIAAGALKIVGYATSATNATATTGYGNIYNIDFSTSCPTPPGSRVPVIINNNPAFAITVTPNSGNACPQVITPLVASSSTSYTTMIWSPATDLFLDASAKVPYAGTSVSGVYLKTNTIGAKTYTVTGTSPGCSNSAIANLLTPKAPSISLPTATPNAVCSGGASTLTVAIAAPSSYCSATGGTGTYFTTDFSTTGGITNISNLASGFSAGGYGYFPLQVVSQVAGGSVSFSGSFNSITNDHGVSIFVDWDQNGTFDAAEKAWGTTAYITNTTTTPNYNGGGSFIVPMTAINGTTRMRLVIDYLSTTPIACDVATSHETEDYTFVVSGGIAAPVYTYNWTESPAGTTLSSPADSAIETATNITVTKIYSVAVSNGTCASRDSVAVLRTAIASNSTASIASPAVSDYVFTPSSSTFAPLSGAISVPIVQDDDEISGDLPLGFTFGFNGNSYTTVRASSNGYLTFNIDGTDELTNNLSTNGSTTLYPMIAPLWDDQDGINGSASYLTSGTAPNRVFTFEWKNWEWNWQAGAAVISYQCLLYEANGRIEFLYNQEAAAATTTSASIGIAGASGNFLSLNGTGTAPTASKTVETITLSTKPATGQRYAFAAPSAIPCPSTNQIISAGITGGGAPYNVLWSSSPAGFSSTLASAAIAPLVNTNYFLRAVDACGDTTRDTIIVLVQPNVLTLTPDSATICGANQIKLKATNGTTYSWTPAFGLSAITGDSVFATPTVPTYVQVGITSASFNNDIVADGVGTSTISGTTYPTIGLDGARYSFIDNTFKYAIASALPTCFMPTNRQAPSLVTSGLTYNFQPYTGLNATSITSPPTNAFVSAIPTTATMTLSTPAAYAKLFVLYESVINTVGPTLTATVTFTDASTQVFSGNALANWFTATAPAFRSVGRTSPTGGIECGTTPNFFPNMFELPLTISAGNKNKLVQSVSFAFSANAGTTDNTVNYFHAMAIGGSLTNPGIPSEITYTVTSLVSGCNLTKSAKLLFTAPPALTAPSVIGTCVPSSVVTTVDSGLVYDTYSFNPSLGTSLSGNEVTFNPSIPTSYILTAVDTVLGCTNTRTIQVNARLSPIPNITPFDTIFCLSPDNALIQVSSVTNGNPASPITLMNQTFSPGLNGWEVSNGLDAVAGLTDGTVAPWKVAANPFPVTGLALAWPTAWTTGNALVSNPRGAGTGVEVRTFITSPSVSTLLYDSIKVVYDMQYDFLGSPDTFALQASNDNGATWNNIKVYRTADVGTSGNFVSETVLLPLTYTNIPNLKIRFYNRAAFGFHTALDNIKINGFSHPTFSWTSSIGGYSSTRSDSIQPKPLADAYYYAQTIDSTSMCSGKDTSLVRTSFIDPTKIFSGGNSGSTDSLVIGCNDVGTGWTYYSGTGSLPTGNFYFAVHWDTNSVARNAATAKIGVSANYILDTSDPSGTDKRGTWLMKKFWNVNLNGGTIGSPVKVRFYFDQSDSATMMNAAFNYAMFNSVSLEPFAWFKTQTGEYIPGANIDSLGVERYNNLSMNVETYGNENGAHYVQFQNVTSFSGGGGAGGAGSGTPLPVELLYFNAKAQGTGNYLNWATASEKNNSHFEIESSTDGEHYSNIGRIIGAGNSVELRTYDFTDENPIANRMYYRLKQVDFDGVYEYSQIRVVSRDGKISFDALVYPVPAKDNITIDILSSDRGLANVTITDITGKLVRTEQVNVSLGNTRTKMDISDLNSGNYIVTIDNGSDRINRKFVKVK